MVKSKTFYRLSISLLGLLMLILVSHLIFLRSGLWLVAFWFLVGLAVFFSWFIDNPQNVAGELVTLVILVVPTLLGIHFLTYSFFAGNEWWIVSMFGVVLICLGCMEAFWKLDLFASKSEKLTAESDENEESFISVPVSREEIVSKKEVFKIRCANCDSLYDASLDRCPNCGSPHRK